MSITVTIKEQPGGDVEVHINQHEGFVTTREGRYADAIAASMKEHLAKSMPAIVKRVLAQEGN